MFRKLQVEFVALVMGVVTLILVAVFVSIGVMTYQQSWTQLSSDLSASISASADKPHPLPPQGGAGPEPPNMGQQPDERMATPVAVYVLEDGVLTVSSRSGALLDDAVRESLAQDSATLPLGVATPCSQGLVALKQDVMGTTYVAFANDSAAASVRSLAPIFVAVGVAALLVFFVVSILFARWALRPVRQAWDQQREFVSNASHELKTPLAIIKANTEILLDEPDEDAEGRAKWLFSTQEATRGMEALVDDMLALAALDERALAKPVCADEEVDVSRLVERAVLPFESRAFEGGFQLEMHIPEGVHVHTEAEALSRLLQVLLDNACKYVNDGGTVQVQLERQGAESVRISVSNTGEAIPPEKLNHIFERFYRVDEARASSTGHGLGLAIAKALADELGATLTATSTPDATTFTLVLST